MSNYVRPEFISMKRHPSFNERWLQDRIVDDPSLLGLGDLQLKGIEVAQPGAGRLDLMLSDPDEGVRYEVEIQLGATDESHIVRTIEYWDIERRRYPQYDHVAVLVAEDITSRFLNVVSIFNGFIPLIALQVQCVQIEGSVTLVVTKVLDATQLGLDDEDEIEPPADRGYWITKKGEAVMALVDQCLAMIQQVDPRWQLNFTKSHIGLRHDGITKNQVRFAPKLRYVNTTFKVAHDPALDQRLEEAGLDFSIGRAGRYRLRITQADLAERHASINELIRRAVAT
jgi:hypothetical protein